MSLDLLLCSPDGERQVLDLSDWESGISDNEVEIALNSKHFADQLYHGWLTKSIATKQKKKDPRKSEIIFHASERVLIYPVSFCSWALPGEPTRDGRATRILVRYQPWDQSWDLCRRVSRPMPHARSAVPHAVALRSGLVLLLGSLVCCTSRLVD